MIRDALTQSQYWNEWIAFDQGAIEESIGTAALPSKNPSYRPQYIRDLAFMHLKLLLRCYSRGDPVPELAKYFEPTLHYWEEAERLGREVWTAEQQQKRHAWALNLDHYIDSFWLVGLALALDVPDSQWQRLLILIGNEGEDALLDRVIATRQKSRKIGALLCYPKPYKALLSCVGASQGEQAAQLSRFLGCWYADLKTAVKSGREKQGYPIRQPYWYEYHTPMKGAYFGYWCVEAVAVVMAFGLNDGLCVGHPHYPGDLLRPGVVTPPDMTRLPAALAASIGAPPASPFTGEPTTLTTWQALKLVIKNKLRS